MQPFTSNFCRPVEIPTPESLVRTAFSEKLLFRISPLVPLMYMPNIVATADGA